MNYEAAFWALIIFICGMAVGYLINLPRPTPRRSRLIKPVPPAGIGSPVVWEAELTCPVCGTEHTSVLPHVAHRCQRCDLVWSPFPIATIGVKS